MSTVLVVEDDVDIAELITFKLAGLGHDLITRHDGESGLAAAMEHLPDLVILDWMMPRLNGLEVCAALREDPRFLRVPVILLTAKAQEVDVQRGFATGVDDFVVKPFSPRELATRVTAQLERARR
jgi:two-component system phosphate regulon response regulator PhoB